MLLVCYASARHENLKKGKKNYPETLLFPLVSKVKVLLSKEFNP